jgi:surface polysaccharide O-acyltransferase-like enzyme
MSAFRNRSEIPILGGPVAIHLWFLYTIIGIYLVVPMLQAFSRYADRKMVWFYLGIAFFGISIIHPIGMITGYRLVGVDFTVFAWPVAYFLCGALMAKIKPSFAVVSLCSAVFVVSGIGTALATWIYSTRFVFKPNEVFYNYFFPLVVIGSVSSFISLKWFGDRYLQGISFVRALSEDTFAIYLVHLIFVYHITRNGFNVVAYPHWWAPVLFSLVAFLASVILIRALRFIPYSGVLIP